MRLDLGEGFRTDAGNIVEFLNALEIAMPCAVGDDLLSAIGSNTGQDFERGRIGFVYIEPVPGFQDLSFIGVSSDGGCIDRRRLFEQQIEPTAEPMILIKSERSADENDYDHEPDGAPFEGAETETRKFLL